MADGLFGSIYDLRKNQMQDLQDSSMELASLPRGRVQVAAAGMAGGQLAQGLNTAFGLKTPEEAKVLKVQQIANRYAASNKNDPNLYKRMSADFAAENLFDYAKEAADIYDQLTTVSKNDISNLGKFMKDARQMLGCDRYQEGTEEYKQCQEDAFALAKDFKSGDPYRDSSAEQLAKEEPKFLESWNDADTKYAKLGQLEGLLADDNFYTGVFSESIAYPANQIGAFFGFENMEKSAAGMELFRSNSMEVALGYVNQTKGAVSDREFLAFLDAAPGLKRTKTGNKYIIATARALAKKEKDKRAEYSKWKASFRPGQKPTLGGWMEHLRKWEEGYDLDLPYSIEKLQKAQNEALLNSEAAKGEQDWNDGELLTFCQENPGDPRCKVFEE